MIEVSNTAPASLLPESGYANSSFTGTPSTAGQMLRQAREAAGVDIALLASALKVSVAKVQALETDRIDLLPDVTFARGLAGAACRALGADPAPVLALLPSMAPALKAQTPRAAAREPFRRASDRPASMLSSGPSKPLLIAVGLLILGALAMWLLPTLPVQLNAPSSSRVSGTVTTPPDNAPMPVPAVEPTGPQPMEVASAPAAGAPGVAGAAAAPSAVAPAPEAAASAPAVVDSKEMIAVNPSGETWFTVRDANGKALIDRAIKPGETVGFSGAAPLSVTIGRVDAIGAITVRGEPFDLKSVTRTNVARFKIK